MTIELECTGKGTHDPVLVYRYDGPMPVPAGWSPRPRHSVMDLYCDRRAGGCGRSPRPAVETLRALLDGLAARGVSRFDVSRWPL